LRIVVATVAVPVWGGRVTGVVLLVLHATMAAGRGDDDNSIMAKTVFELAGVR
jgi:hypothetical protein